MSENKRGCQISILEGYYDIRKDSLDESHPFLMEAHLDPKSSQIINSKSH